MNVILQPIMENLYNSPNLKKQTYQALAAIAFFILSYLVLLASALLLALLCGYGAFFLFSLRLSYITVMLGIGVFSIGILILYFLLKFMFKTSKTDISNLIEISKEEEPKLFALIEEIADEVQTQKPKHVYLSNEINAYVFYDSSFWSMFLPIRKNLAIGVGLMNVVTQQEFKAIIAHEFGHFSQKSMKVGSYVYNVNKVIHNLLFDNDSYNSAIASWANLNSYFAFFTSIAIKIVEGIQFVLMRLYEIVNLKFYALSREMEFHADAVAASIAGSQPLIDSLRRLPLADNAFSETMNFYHSKAKDGIVAENIFTNQQNVLEELAKEYKLPLTNKLPFVDEHFENRFPKSRLEFNKQWMSHPETEERAQRLLSYNQISKSTINSKAIELLQHQVETQKLFSSKSFSYLEENSVKTELKENEFLSMYLEDKNKNNLPAQFNGYYDFHPFPSADLKAILLDSENLPLKDLTYWCSQENKSNLMDYNNTLRDKATLEWIVNPANKTSIKTFDYAGQRYKVEDAVVVLVFVTQHLEKVEKQLGEIDKGIIKFLFQRAKENQHSSAFEKYYEEHQKGLELFTSTDELVQTVYKKLEFISEQTAFETIVHNFKIFKPEELLIKEKMNQLFKDEKQVSLLSEDQHKAMLNYKDRELVYFEDNAYDQVALDIMFDAIQAYQSAFNYIWFDNRKNILSNFLALAKY